MNYKYIHTHNLDAGEARAFVCAPVEMIMMCVRKYK